MARFQNPGALFLGTLIAQEQKFLKPLLANAKRNGYTRVVEPCAGAFAMSHLAAQVGYDEQKEWVQLTAIFGSSAIPKEAEEVITLAIKKMIESGDINAKNKWRAIELWAADYLGGE